MLIWKAHSRMIDALAFSPDGGALAVSGYHLGCRLIDPLSGARLWTVGSNSAFGLSLGFAAGRVLCRQSGLSVRARDTGDEERRIGDWCQSFALSPDERVAFVADNNRGRVCRCLADTGAKALEVELDAGAINRLAVSPDGKLLAAVGCKRFGLLDAITLAEREHESHRALSSGAFALAFSPDGRFLAYSAGRTMFVTDVPANREAAVLHLPSKHFMDAAFSPDGRFLLTASKEGTVRLYATASWALEKSFDWGVGPLRAVAVAPDGTRAATAGDAGRVVVWDLDT